MKKILLSSAFPVILFLHVGVKVFFPGLFAYGSSEQAPATRLTSAAIHPTEIIALAQDALATDPFRASIPGSALSSESPIPTQP